MNPVTTVLSNHSAAVRARNRFAVHTIKMSERKRLLRSEKPEKERYNQIVFPRSRNRAPGLHSLMASSNECRVVRISLADSSDISPTGYVALRSPWKPARALNKRELMPHNKL